MNLQLFLSEKRSTFQRKGNSVKHWLFTVLEQIEGKITKAQVSSKKQKELPAQGNLQHVVEGLKVKLNITYCLDIW